VPDKARSKTISTDAAEIIFLDCTSGMRKEQAAAATLLKLPRTQSPGEEQIYPSFSLIVHVVPFGTVADGVQSALFQENMPASFIVLGTSQPCGLHVAEVNSPTKLQDDVPETVNPLAHVG